MTFLTIPSPIARAMAERNYDRLTPVQNAVIADDAADRDLLVSAQTGSGKTVAYGLAIAHDILGDADKFEAAAAPLALIVAPTRELALQVQRELAWLYQHANGRVVSCVGGMDPRREQRELAAGAHIVVGTPGRLCDHLRRNRLDVSNLKVVVLDEADEMLNLGFREDMEFILNTTPDNRRTLLFSATMPREIASMAKKYQQQAFRIEVAGDEGGHADIEYRAIRIAAGDVEHAVVNVLRFFESPSALVFCNTREAVRHLQAALLERGFAVVALSGELTQNERTQALQTLRDGRARVCVATDVAARGIDLPTLDLVIHADLPNDAEVLQHRSGRTGRAGRKGVSVVLVPPARRRRAEVLLNLAGVDVAWSTPPTSDEIRELDQKRMLQDALFAHEVTAEDLVLARALLAERSPEDIAAALARLYRSRLPSPEDVLDPGQNIGRSHDRSQDRTRDNRSREKDTRPSRDDDRAAGRKGKSQRHGMAEGSVWFRAAIGRQKNAEARWLLPMICRRGGIDKNDIGSIIIGETSTKFEISSRVADSFAGKIRRPDKEDNIRIELLAEGAQTDERSEERPHKPRREAARDDRNARQNDRERDERGSKPYRKPHDDAGFEKPRFEKPKFEDSKFKKPKFENKFDRDAGPKAKKPWRDKPDHAERPRQANKALHAKPAFGKKPKKKNRRD